MTAQVVEGMRMHTGGSGLFRVEWVKEYAKLKYLKFFSKLC